jgi:hypothetical protein
MHNPAHRAMIMFSIKIQLIAAGLEPASFAIAIENMMQMFPKAFKIPLSKAK